MSDVLPDDQEEMDVPANIHSFIVRLWPEKTVYGDGLAVWRGHITHIPGGERRFITEIDDIPEFIQSHLKDTGEP